MIGYLSGRLLRTMEYHVTIDVGGVGYEVYMGNTAGEMSSLEGEQVALWVHTHVREDQISLFGFKSASEKSLFQTLLGVSGVGPKLAHAVIAAFEPGSLVEAISLGDTRQLQTVPGIGKKMAERMVLELKERISLTWSDVATARGGEKLRVWDDLVKALSGLGFPDAKIRNVVRLLQKEQQGKTVGLDDILRQALQKINQC